MQGYYLNQLIHVFLFEGKSMDGSDKFILRLKSKPSEKNKYAKKS
jgi:hypothetical protein